MTPLKAPIGDEFRIICPECKTIWTTMEIPSDCPECGCTVALEIVRWARES